MMQRSRLQKDGFCRRGFSPRTPVFDGARSRLKPFLRKSIFGRRGFRPEPPSSMAQRVAAEAAPTKIHRSSCGGASAPNVHSISRCVAMKAVREIDRESGCPHPNSAWGAFRCAFICAFAPPFVDGPSPKRPLYMTCGARDPPCPTTPGGEPWACRAPIRQAS